MKQTVVLGITGGIAAYKLIDLASQLRKEEIEVIVMMTKHAASIVNPAEFVKATRHKVYRELFPQGFDYQKILTTEKVDHIQVADSADIIVIAPATANSIAKLAYGIADDFLTTTLLATRAPVLICPSMNVNMWHHKTVQDNLQKLKELGYLIMPPDSGHLACGYEGVGRLADTAKIRQKILHIIKTKNQLKGKKILVTAGGTSEPIDAVRTITNRSTGKMGVALADECRQRGAEVILLRSAGSVTPHTGMQEHTFETTVQLSELVKKYTPDCDAIFHVAAVSDYIPEKKIDKKLDSAQPLTLHLTPSEKISDQIKTWNPRIKLIVFKALYNVSDETLKKKSKEKLSASRADYVIANDVGRPGVGFAVDTNEVYIVSEGTTKKLAKAPKAEIAAKIIDNIHI